MVSVAKPAERRERVRIDLRPTQPQSGGDVQREDVAAVRPERVALP
jgi:hypothetical protein